MSDIDLDFDRMVPKPLKERLKPHDLTPDEGSIMIKAKLLREAVQRIERLEDALRFYADPVASVNAAWKGLVAPEVIPDFYNELDFGYRARRALEEV